MDSLTIGDASISHRFKSIFGGSVGNLVEWFDWLTFSTFSLYFAHIFFPKGNQTVQLMDAAAVFAVGHIFRPLGAIYFGWMADKRGRREALSLSVLMMCFSSLMVAIIPGYKVIGLAAPILLICARILQGLSVGGEYGTSAAYIMEVSAPRQRGLNVSMLYTTLLVGQLASICVLMLLQYVFLTAAQLNEWGWRIPFVIGGLLGLVALYIRRGIDESPEYLAEQAQGKVRANPLRLLIHHPREIALVFGLTMGGALAANTFNVYMPKFLVNTAHFSKEQSTLISLLSIIAFMIMQPFVGALSDKVGRRPVLIAFGVLGTLLTVPLLNAIATSHSTNLALLLVIAGLTITSCYTAINAVVKAELFSVEMRAVGIGIPYALATSLFGGTAEYIGLQFKNAGWEQGYFYYISAGIFISLLVFIFMRETAPKADNTAR